MQLNDSFMKLIRAAGKISITTLTQTILIISRLKKFVKADTWEQLATVLRDVSQTLSLDEEANKHLSRKDILEFTENLERILLHAHDAINTSEPAA